MFCYINGGIRTAKHVNIYCRAILQTCSIYYPLLQVLSILYGISIECPFSLDEKKENAQLIATNCDSDKTHCSTKNFTSAV